MVKVKNWKLGAFLYMNESSGFPIILAFWFISLKISNQYLSPSGQIFSLEKSLLMPYVTGHFQAGPVSCILRVTH